MTKRKQGRISKEKHIIYLLLKNINSHKIKKSGIFQYKNKRHNLVHKKIKLIYKKCFYGEK